jgi:hypothetical protein
MRTTFYIASAAENHVAVRRLADFLMSRGWRWASGNAWGRDRVYDPVWVVNDMRAVLGADVFILLLSGDSAVGPHAQLSARWVSHKTIYGIRNEAPHHPLHELPGIVWFDAMEDFAQATFGT